ncbi:hypothetical protein HGP28_16190 [Vibrio sp. SM6]|uniref:Lipoprotein n=1 Tax=Vibrio agarilyticus TaxID=2726741 RepID=A0A7X8TT57_9VIBR|nr:hypothetical protein [Vibrio agarilyticus]NLS14420.1 hypothetical protein [Vibrio agarilyticus]
MKKTVITLTLLLALAGCEEASKAVDKAQEAANSAVDSMQEELTKLDLSALKLDEQFGDAAEAAQELAVSLEEALNADFSNPEALTKVQEHIANAYSCLEKATSDSSAEALLNKIMDTISNEQAKGLIEKGIEQAKEVKECVM